MRAKNVEEIDTCRSSTNAGARSITKYTSYSGLVFSLKPAMIYDFSERFKKAKFGPKHIKRSNPQK
jgi:hypothetical protein